MEECTYAAGLYFVMPWPAEMPCVVAIAAAARQTSAAEACGDAAAGARPDLDNNDKSRPARKSSHHQLKKCFDTKNYYYSLTVLSEILSKQNKKIEKKNLAPILVRLDCTYFFMLDLCIRLSNVHIMGLELAAFWVSSLFRSRC